MKANKLVPEHKTKHKTKHNFMPKMVLFAGRWRQSKCSCRCRQNGVIVGERLSHGRHTSLAL